jgi:hypothetical protein
MELETTVVRERRRCVAERFSRGPGTARRRCESRLLPFHRNSDPKHGFKVMGGRAPDARLSRHDATGRRYRVRPFRETLGRAPLFRLSPRTREAAGLPAAAPAVGLSSPGVTDWEISDSKNTRLLSIVDPRQRQHPSFARLASEATEPRRLLRAAARRPLVRLRPGSCPRSIDSNVAISDRGVLRCDTGSWPRFNG